MGLESKVLEPSYSFSEIGGTDAEIIFEKPALTKINVGLWSCRPLELSASETACLRNCRPQRIADNGYDKLSVKKLSA